MTISTIIIIILLSVAFTSIFIIVNLLKKLEAYEEAIEENDKFISEEMQRNISLLDALRQIDQRQMFEKDDDVGSIFYQIKETIERFKQY